MALNQKYSWADFLHDHPDEKGLKRTSPEGKKAFESAYKAYLKEYLKRRLGRLQQQQKVATDVRNELVAMLKETKLPRVARRVQLRVGQKDHAVAVIAKQIERTKEVQKQF